MSENLLEDHTHRFLKSITGDGSGKILSSTAEVIPGAALHSRPYRFSHNVRMLLDITNVIV